MLDTGELKIISGTAVWTAAAAQPHTAVAVQNCRIVAVGLREDLLRAYPAATHHHFPHCILMPGMVNAHTHLELGYLRGQIPPGPLVEWIKALFRHIAAHKADLPQLVADSVRAGIAENLRHGVTTVGDITKHIAHSRPALCDGAIRSVSFGEVGAVIGILRDRAPDLIAAASNRQYDTARCRTGLSPHAPYTVEGPVLRQIVQAAQADRRPLCMHLAELSEETEFLATLQGRIREVWDLAGRAAMILDDQIPRHAGGPIRWARDWGLLPAGGIGVPVVLAHVNYASDEELEILAASRTSVAYCPRARAYYGHDAHSPHRFPDMLARGINVCLGTDSLGCVDTLSMLDEVRFLKTHRPEISADTLLDLITRRGAIALGMDAEIGTLEVGKRADVVAVQVQTDNLPAPPATADAILQSGQIQQVWIDGEPIP